MDEVKSFLVEKAHFGLEEADKILPLLQSAGVDTLGDLKWCQPVSDLTDIPIVKRRKIAMGLATIEAGI